jgi:hypothetical protein
VVKVLRRGVVRAAKRKVTAIIAVMSGNIRLPILRMMRGHTKKTITKKTITMKKRAVVCMKMKSWMSMMDQVALQRTGKVETVCGGDNGGGKTR